MYKMTIPFHGCFVPKDLSKGMFISMNNMKFVLATANPGKIKEMRRILSELDVEVITRDELAIDIEIEETGSTFKENSLLKASVISKLSNLPAIADDSGLIVDALFGEPGVYSSSYGGSELTADERCKYLLKKMENKEQRQAKFVCTIVCVFPDGNIITAEGECSGVITTAPSGSNGFGYDPVFKPVGYETTMALLTIEEKNKISHRGAALRDFVDLLKSYRAGGGASAPL